MHLDATASLHDGRRARVRFPHAIDRVGIVHLHERLGVTVDELELAREMRFDPRTRVALCATAWSGTEETIVAWATARRGRAEADMLVADETLAPGVTELITVTLTRHARSAA